MSNCFVCNKEKFGGKLDLLNLNFETNFVCKDCYNFISLAIDFYIQERIYNFPEDNVNEKTDWEERKRIKTERFINFLKKARRLND